MRHVIWILTATSLAAQSGIVSLVADEQPRQGYSGSLQSTTLVPGSLAVISAFGGILNFTTATVSIRYPGQTTLIPATVLSAANGRITFVVPTTLNTGAVQVIYRPNGDITRWVAATIAPSRLLLFPAFPSGPVVAQAIRPDGRAGVVGMARPVAFGQSLVLWGSGLGNTSASQVQVFLGGVPQKILFSGPSPGLSGVDQINLLVSSATPAGCYVPLVAHYGEQSFASTISVSSDGSPCVHSLGLSPDALAQLDGGSSLLAGQFDITSDLIAASSDHASRQESMQLSLLPRAPLQIKDYSASNRPAAGCTSAEPTVREPLFAIGSTIRSLQLFGPYIKATNGNSSAFLESSAMRSAGTPPYFFDTRLPPSTDAPLTALPPPLFEGGLWTFTSPPNTRATFQLNFPRPLQLPGTIPHSFRRVTDGTVSWKGADYDDATQATVSLTGIESTLLSPATILCTAPASSGQITIPQAMLSAMPVGAATLTVKMTRRPASILLPASYDLGRTFFQLPLISTISTSDTRPADIQ